jgi:hypothetical protein
VTNTLFGLTLTGDIATSADEAAFWERDPRNRKLYEPSLLDDRHTVPLKAPRPAQSPVTPNPSFDRLWILDHEMVEQLNDVKELLDNLSCPAELSPINSIVRLEEKKRWVDFTIQEIKQVGPGTNEAAVVLQDAMLSQLKTFQEGLQDCLRRLGARTQDGTESTGVFFDTGNICTTITLCWELNINADQYLKNDLHRVHPLTLVSVFMVLLLNVFGRVTRPWCNAVLSLLKIILSHVFSETEREKKILDHFPTDVRSVRKIFDLEASTIVYACCPVCSAVYKPKRKKKILVYPRRCTHRRYCGHRPCGAALTQSRVQDGESVRAPTRPFAVQDFDAFVARLLSQPGMEEAMDRGTMLNERAEMWDIKDGSGIWDIKGPDGQPFMDGLRRGELRLAWSLSVDWFNPYLNKTSGKSASVGSIAMALLNLPPSLRYKSECLYLMGVIPGPKEPSLDEVDHFLSVLVDMLLPSWKQGTWFKQTHHNRNGRLSRSVIAVAVNDLPAARKVYGFASHSANIFCAMCKLTKNEIRNLDHLNWPKSSRDEYIKAAEAWRDAPSKTKRKRLYKENGIRWSILLRLPYWDPTKCIVVDCMHNLFLGLVQFHFRQVIGIDHASEGDQIQDDRSVNENDMVKARAALSKPTLKTLRRLTIPVLQCLCAENRVNIAVQGNRQRKTDLISALLVR